MASDKPKRSRRLGLDDFNYTFVGYEPPSSTLTRGREGGGDGSGDGVGDGDGSSAPSMSPDPTNAGGGGGGGDVTGDGASVSGGTPMLPPSNVESASASANEGDRKEASLTAASSSESAAASPRDRSNRDNGVDDGPTYSYAVPKRQRHLRACEDGEDVYGGGEGGGATAVMDDPSAAAAPLLGAACCCCCLTSALIVAGGVLISYHDAYAPYNGGDNGGQGEVGRGKGTVLFAGYVCFVAAAASCLLGCCSFCVGCVSSIVGGKMGDGISGGMADRDPREVRVRLRRLNGQIENGEEALNQVRLDVTSDIDEVKEAKKKEAKQAKEREKKEREELEQRVKSDLSSGKSVDDVRRAYRPVCFLVRFDGDTSVSDMDLLRTQVSLIVNQGNKHIDRAVFVITSPGGEVSQYGLAASQLVRIRKAGIRLVVCVDSVAASGGYMMASVADVICAAPFAIVGSIGVLAQIPNFHRLLDKHDVDAYTFTAGRYKRTVDPIGEVTEEGKAKFVEELEEIHGAFMDHVALSRPRLDADIESISTGEAWLAVQAKEKGLVDRIMTSDEYLGSIQEQFDIIELVRRRHRPGWYGAIGDLSGFAAKGMRGAVEGLRSAVEAPTPRTRYTPMAIS